MGKMKTKKNTCKENRTKHKVEFRPIVTYDIIFSAGVEEYTVRF